jgi:hypothetical protein
MQYTKERIVAVILILIGVAMIYYGWYYLRTEGVYYLKMATFSPLLVLGGIFLLFFPWLREKPTTKKRKVIVLLVFLVGMIAGLINWYLMDPDFFRW